MTVNVSQSARLDSLDALGGFDMISNGDSPAGPKMISAEMYLKYAKPYEKKIVEIASQAGVAYTLHICDNTDVTLEHMLLTGADAFELDYKTDITNIFNTIYNTTTFIGNIEPSGVLP